MVHFFLCLLVTGCFCMAAQTCYSVWASETCFYCFIIRPFCPTHKPYFSFFVTCILWITATTFTNYSSLVIFLEKNTARNGYSQGRSTHIQHCVHIDLSCPHLFCAMLFPDELPAHQSIHAKWFISIWMILIMYACVKSRYVIMDQLASFFFGTLQTFKHTEIDCTFM